MMVFKRICGLCLTLAMVLAILPATGMSPLAAETETAEETTTAGLELRAIEGIKVTLYEGFASTTVISPAKTYTEDGVNCYYYSGLQGSYHYKVSGTGYYTITKNIYISEEEAAGLVTVDVTPGKIAGAGWESLSVNMPTDEYAANFPSDPSLWPDYQEAFQTPAFTIDHADHAYTTQKEMEDFIAQLDQSNGDMYTYVLGTTANGLNVPVTVFTKTDLSGADSLEEVAALLKGNGKPTIHYQGQMHGNEPAGGEGTLAMILKLCGTYGNKVLDDVNIYVIPRVNPDGSKNNVRVIPSQSIDMNRDALLVRTVEMSYLHKISNLFEPVLRIDSHEYTMEPDRTAEVFSDILLSPAYSPINTKAFADAGIHMAQYAFDAIDSQGLSYNFYLNYTNSQTAYVGRNYAALEGTLSVLIETRGIYYGNEMYERRTVGHLVATTALIDYFVANKTQLCALVAAEREQIAQSGATYETSDLVVLKTGSSSHPELNIPSIRYNTATGVGTNYTIPIKAYDVVDRSRPAPTAYVIPAQQSWTQDVLDVLDKHGISYYSIPAGSHVVLQKYTGNTTEAGLTEEMAVSFADGAWVLPMNHQKGKILAMLMEPDVTDISGTNGTLAMAGVIPADTDGYPIYRYVKNLNADGTITHSLLSPGPVGLVGHNAPTAYETGSISGLEADKRYEYRLQSEAEYTAVAPNATAITGLVPGTYLVRYQAEGDQQASADTAVSVACDVCQVYVSATGSDTNSGYKEGEAVATLEKAYAQLSKIMTEGQKTPGTIQITGKLDLGAKAVDLPAHSYPVILRGKSADDGIVYTGGGTDKTTVINFHGDTTLEHMTIQLNSTLNYNYIGGNGHRLVMGEGIHCIANSKGAYFNLCGGSFGGTYESTNLTVQSGTFRNIYYGTYTGTVTGDAVLTVTGGTVTHTIQSNYRGTVGGNGYVQLSNVTLGNRVLGGNNNSGTVEGNITVTLGKGISGTPVIAPALSASVTGTYTVILDGADLSAMTVQGKPITSGTVGASGLILKNGTVGQVSGFGNVTLQNAKYVRLAADVTQDITVEGKCYLDLQGHTVSGAVAGTGTLYGMDCTGDDFDLPEGKLTGPVSCQVESSFKTSLTGKAKRYLAINDNGYSFHAVSVDMTHMSLQPEKTGVGYKAVFQADSAVKAALAEEDAFGFVLWVGQEGTRYTYGKTREEFVSGQTVPLRLENFDVENHGQTHVYGKVFMKLADGTVVESGIHSYTLRQLLEKVASNVSQYTPEQITAVQQMIAVYADAMSKWKLDAIRNYQ